MILTETSLIEIGTSQSLNRRAQATTEAAACVVPRIREQMPARVPKHVRMGVGQPCAFARSLDHL